MNLLKKLRLHFLKCEIRNIEYWLATNKTGGAKRLLRYARIKGIKRALEA